MNPDELREFANLYDFSEPENRTCLAAADAWEDQLRHAWDEVTHLRALLIEKSWRLEAAEMWRRNVIDAWNEWGLHGDSPGMLGFVAAFAGEEKP